MAGFPQNPGFFPDVSMLDYFYGMGQGTMPPPRYGGNVVNDMRYQLGVRDSLDGWRSFLDEIGAGTPPSLNSAINSINSPAPPVTNDYTMNISENGGNAYEYAGGGSGNRGRGAGNGGTANASSNPGSFSGGNPGNGFYNAGGKFRDRMGGGDGIIGNGGGNRDRQRNGQGNGQRDMPGRLSAREIIDRIQARVNGNMGGSGGSKAVPGSQYRRMANQIGMDTSGWKNTAQGPQADYMSQVSQLPQGVLGANGRITYPSMPQPTQGYAPPATNTPPPRPQNKPYPMAPDNGQMFMGGNPNFNEFMNGMNGSMNNAMNGKDRYPIATPPSFPPAAPQPGRLLNNPYIARAQRMGMDTSGWGGNGQNARTDFRQAMSQRGPRTQ